MNGTNIDEFYDLWKRCDDGDRRVILSMVIDNVPPATLCKALSSLSFETRELIVERIDG